VKECSPPRPGQGKRRTRRAQRKAKNYAEYTESAEKSGREKPKNTVRSDCATGGAKRRGTQDPPSENEGGAPAGFRHL